MGHRDKTGRNKKIDGNVIGDDSIWGSQTTPDGWVWQDIGNYYGGGASALSWRENQFDVHLKANPANDNVTIVKTIPEMPYLKIVNELKPGAEGTGDRVYAYLPPLANTAYLRGTWAQGISKSGISAALPDPAYDAAFRLQDTLLRLGHPGISNTGHNTSAEGRPAGPSGDYTKTQYQYLSHIEPDHLLVQ